jgi:hypothetical protein
MIAVLAAAVLFLVAPAAEPSPSPASDATPGAASTPARASNGSVRIFGGSYTLPQGEVRDNVQVTGGSVRIEGTVTRDVTVFGGSATIDGTVGHDVRVTGGSVSLGPDSSVGHDVSVFGGSVSRAPGSQVGHDVLVTGRDADSSRSFFSWWPLTESFPFGGVPFNFFPGLGLAVTIVLVGLLIHAFFPRQLSTAGAALVEQPLASLGVGCVTTIAGVLVALLLAITILLILGSLAVMLAMLAAFLFGWTAIIMVVGQRIMERLDWQGGPIPALMVGGVLAALVLNVPFLGGLVLLLGGALALGAVVLTRFGTQPASQLPPPR